MANEIGKWLKEAQRHAAAGHLEEAEGLCRQILDIAPEHAGAMLELGRVLYHRRKLGESIEALESVLQQEPANIEARILLIYGHVEGGDRARGIALAHEARERSQNPGELLAAYMAFDTLCDWKHTQQMQDRILDLAAQGSISNALMPSLLMVLNAVPGISPERMLELHRVWGERQEREARQRRFRGKPHPPMDGKLKIGYLSADFCQHPVGHFIQSLITHHDRERFEVYCYAILPFDDARTARIREAADHFIDVTELSPYEIAQRIHEDNIHIMVDLSGHTGLSRVQALAFRPAPVQMTYLGYPNTTGLSTIDFRITDAFAEDAEHGTQYVEQLLYMPQSFLCAAEFMQDIARVEVTPATKNGHITFGSFNHVRKLNPETIALWSRILQGVEGSRLVIKAKGCDSPIVRENILTVFARHGVDAERIQFHGTMERHAEHAAIYNEVDIALDSFPYNGTTTTCETLWMGVPVITLLGPQHVQRTSYSILKNIGLDATIAHTPDEYVEKAINLSKGLDNLNVLRQCLPTLLRHSPLGQPETFTRQIEALYMQAWQDKTGIKIEASDINGENKKPLRLIHNLARSGSTLMCKCLGAMQGISLLSEIHPQAVEQFNPLDQAHEWFGLLTPEDIAALKTTPPSFVDAIRLIEQRSSERGEALVIRDWAHLDFAGVPFLPVPTFQLKLAETLAESFELKQIAFVRHPIDLWLSLSRLEIMQQPIASGHFGIDEFIHGYLRFAQACVGFGLIRYEDFARAPEDTMQQVCAQLDIPYDPSFIENWSTYTTITGDVVSTRGGSEIKLLKRREVSAQTLERFTDNPEYGQLLDLLGYEEEATETHRQEKSPEASTPEISVLVLAYNHEPFIRQAVQSLFHQDYPGAVEIIISDDASSDKTADIIEQEIANYRGPFTVSFNRNRKNSGGVVAHLNQLMDMARGRLIVSAAGDDIYLPFCIRKIAEAWNEGAGGSVFRANPSMIDNEGKRTGRKLLAPEQEQPDLDSTRDMISRGFAEAWCIAWDRSVLDEFGPLPCNTRNEDQLIPFRGALLKGYRFIPGDFLEYRAHQNNLSIWRRLQLAQSDGEKEELRLESIANMGANLMNWADALRRMRDAKRIDPQKAGRQIEQLEERVAAYELQSNRIVFPRNLPLRSEEEIMASWSGDPDRPRVSICCAVFNHGPWIQDALHGFLMQDTRFPFEIIIRDDASTDDSAAIISQYAARYPNIIRVQINKENSFADERAIHVWPDMARGDHIALCEGDDFWTSRDKLQKQVERMDAHPEAVMCLARTHYVEYKDGQEPIYKGTTCPPDKALLDFEDAHNTYAHPSTYLIRAKLFKEVVRTYFAGHCLFGDTELRAILVSYGPFALLNEAVSVYRVTGKGIWSSLNQHDQLQWDYESAEKLAEMMHGKHKKMQEDRMRTLAKQMEQLGRMRA